MIDIVPDRAVLLGDTIRPQTAAIEPAVPKQMVATSHEASWIAS